MGFFSSLFLICTFFILTACPGKVIVAGLDTPVCIEAEDGAILGQALRLIDRKASGEQSMGWIKSAGDGIRFTGVQAGSLLSIRYAAAGSVKLSLSFNGKPVSQIALKSTGGENNYGKPATTALKLTEKGMLDIIYKKGNAGIKIDYILIHNEKLVKDFTLPLKEKEQNPVQWKGYTRKNFTIQSKKSTNIPFVIVFPKKYPEPVPCVLAIHGMTGAKEEWLITDGYCKGGNVTLKLLELGYAVAMLDLPMHGDRMDFEYTDSEGQMAAVNEQWDAFMEQGFEDARASVAFLKNVQGIDGVRLGVIGYSLGALFTYILADLQKGNIKAAVSCVAPIPTGYIWEGAPQDFADMIDTVPFLMIIASRDTNYTVENAKILFTSIPVKDKDLKIYDSEHNLPALYAEDAASWFYKYL